jgi:hypothetical protein
VETLRLLKLQRKDDDTSTKPIKETFLTVENGSFHVYGPQVMINGKDWNVNSDIKFNEQAIISFFDEDSIRNLSTTKQFINYIVKEENDIYNGRPNKINFATNTADYILTYEIM